MRIVSGRLKGRLFDAPRGHRTHPMGDKVRGALFSVLGDIHGLTVLDAYGGSGALSYEAVSRGAASVLVIEVDNEAYETIVRNVKSLDLSEQVTVLRKNVGGWSRNNQTKQFDLVLADPPYDDINPKVLQRLVVNVKPGGLMVLSWPGSEPVRELEGLDYLTSKQYGDAQLVFYRRMLQ
jgi:16S rRNA (guanine966-N2)-methyltransferase